MSSCASTTVRANAAVAPGAPASSLVDGTLVEWPDLDSLFLEEISGRTWRGGWGEYPTPGELQEMACHDVAVLIDQIRDFAPGTVVARSQRCGPVVARLAGVA